jgi:hypothetical protein
MADSVKGEGHLPSTFFTCENNLVISAARWAASRIRRTGRTISSVPLHKPAMTALGAQRQNEERLRTPWLERSGLDLPYHPRGPTDHNTTTATAANTSCCSGVGGEQFLLVTTPSCRR